MGKLSRRSVALVGALALLAPLRALAQTGTGPAVPCTGDPTVAHLIEVTIDNTVVVRQEKDNDTYLLDESETHDRAMTKAEVDAAIEDVTH